jgi:hypothetical protein
MSFNLTSRHIEIASERIKRALKYIEDFDREVDKFLDLNPYKTIIGDIQCKRDKYVVTIYLQVVKEAPINLRLIAGDAIHNLGATLDNLLWAIAQRKFPIYSDPVKFYSIAPNFVKCPPDVQVLIRDLQPYKARNRVSEHPLRVLSNLWGGDKHEAPVLLGGGSFTVGFSHLLDVKCIRYEGGGVENGAEIATFASSNLKSIKNLNPDFVFDVSFNKRGDYRIARFTLTTIHDFIRDEVIAKLAPFAK